MAFFTIALPPAIAKKFDEEANPQDIVRSALIAHYTDQHYEGKFEADAEEIQQTRTESADSTQREQDE